MNNRFRFWAICALLVAVFLPARTVRAQIEEPNGCMTSARGMVNYHILIVDQDIVSNHNKLYLEGYHCGTLCYLDSATVKNGKVKFKNKRPVDMGVYRLVYEKGGPSVWDIILLKSHTVLMTYRTRLDKSLIHT